MQGVKSDVANWQHCLIKGYTHSLGGTPLNDSPVFGGLIGTVARELSWKQHGEARLALSFTTSWLGELSPRKAVGLLGPKVLGTNASMKRRVADSDDGAAILLRFALASYLSYLAR